MQNLSGKHLKGYRVLRRLGRGAMAEVFLAEQTSLGRQVALKVLNADLAGDPVYVDRFDREARAAAALVHGSIVQIYEVGQSDGVHFIAQEYVPGRNLGDLIRRSGRISPGQTLDIIRQVAAALHKASQHGIVHRDIKPENILLTAAGEVKVADFGLARVMSAQNTNELTQVGVTMGTPLYMSPEQVEGRPLDSRSDIYSLGITAYHMITGQPPFQGDTPLAVAVQHINEPAPPLESRIDGLSPQLSQLIHRMIEKKPTERPTSPAQVLAELRELAAGAAEQGWGHGPEDWSAVELTAAAGTPGSQTGRLAELMLASSRVRLRPFSTAILVGIAVACTIVGVALASYSRPAPLLATARSGTPRRDSVLAQLYQAKTADTESAWRAVEKYYPNADEYIQDWVTEGLVRHYLYRSREYEKAIPLLEELASKSREGSWSRAFANAGLTIAYTALGRPDAAGSAIEQITPDVRTMLAERDPQLAELLSATLDVFYERDIPTPPEAGAD